MNFKEALIAHLNGEKVECRLKENWQCIDFMSEFEDLSIHSVVNHDHDDLYTFRLTPRTITVNGVEVPAPESAPPVVGATYYVPTPDTDVFYSERWNQCKDVTMRHLQRGLVYLNKEDAIARAKAMLLHE